MKKLRSFKITRKNVLPLAMLAALVMVLVSAGGFAFAASQEEHDSFCASCHTQPESTYFERSIAQSATDLASAHKPKETRCIDCHSGEGVLGRISAEMMGAQNAMKWYTGMAKQPAPLIYPIGDENCVKCHAEVLTEKHDSNSRTKDFGPKGHYHAYFIQWKEADKSAANCTSCHSGHAQGGAASKTWVIPASVQDDCEACHKLMGSN